MTLKQAWNDLVNHKVQVASDFNRKFTAFIVSCFIGLCLIVVSMMAFNFIVFFTMPSGDDRPSTVNVHEAHERFRKNSEAAEKKARQDIADEQRRKEIAESDAKMPGWAEWRAKHEADK